MIEPILKYKSGSKICCYRCDYHLVNCITDIYYGGKDNQFEYVGYNPKLQPRMVCRGCGCDFRLLGKYGLKVITTGTDSHNESSNQ